MVEHTYICLVLQYLLVTYDIFTIFLGISNFPNDMECVQKFSYTVNMLILKYSVVSNRMCVCVCLNFWLKSNFLFNLSIICFNVRLTYLISFRSQQTPSSSFSFSCAVCFFFSFLNNKQRNLRKYENEYS